MIGWLKLAGVGLAAAAMLGLGLIVKNWHDEAARVPVLEAEIAQAKVTVETERRLKTEADAASRGYQDELEKLRAARAAAPVRTVRLCINPAVPAHGEGAAAQPGSDGAAAPGGEFSEGTGSNTGQGPDIGPDLAALADRADQLSAQVRGLQDYINRIQAEQHASRSDRH